MSDVTEHLNKVLAETLVLYFKTHSFHWNVEGPQFHTLHALFGEQYTALWTVSDELAERLRALQSYAPDNFASILKASSIGEVGQTPDADEMLKILLADHEEIGKTISDAIKVAEKAGDEVTTDMLIGRLTEHEKTAWMLRSLQK